MTDEELFRQFEEMVESVVLADFDDIRKQDPVAVSIQQR